MIDVKELMKQVTVDEFCRTADEYFKAIKDPTPQMRKPFSNAQEASSILQKMGQMLSELHIGPGLTILEFGAGTCWFSRFLSQMQCQTIACDVSKAALEIGQRLFSEYPIVGEYVAEPKFLHFDGYNLDLPDASVDRIVCHDAFHHIPNQERVLAEMARVLKQGGIAAFGEPGKFHSRSPQSQYEMKNYTVLENDIILPEIFTLASKHGFTDIKCKLQCNMLLTLPQYSLITDNKPHSTLQAEISNNIQREMTDNTIFFLYKGELRPDSISPIGLSHTISLIRPSPKGTAMGVKLRPEVRLGKTFPQWLKKNYPGLANRLRSYRNILPNNIEEAAQQFHSSVLPTFITSVNEKLNLPLRITNNGGAIWLHDNVKGLGVVKIGTHLYDDTDKLIDLDFSRDEFEEDILPGTTLEQTISVQFNQTGQFKLAIDMVSEHVCWFENNGSRPLVVHVTVN